MECIYRVQNDEGWGCYHNGGAKKNELYHEDEPNHPHPLYDIGIKRYPRSGERHGFESVEKAYKWFTEEEFERMHDNGYELVRIDIEDIEIQAIGECQLLFTIKISSILKGCCA